MADIEAIKNLDQVVDVVSNKVSFQITIGTEVSQIYPELLSLMGRNEEDQSKVKVKKTFLKRFWLFFLNQ